MLWRWAGRRKSNDGSLSRCSAAAQQPISFQISAERTGHHQKLRVSGGPPRGTDHIMPRLPRTLPGPKADGQYGADGHAYATATPAPVIIGLPGAGNTAKWAEAAG